MGITDAYEMAPPVGQAVCNGRSSACPSPQSSPSSVTQPPMGGAVTWALGMCLRNGGAGELGRALPAF